MPAAQPWSVSALRGAAAEARNAGAPQAASNYLRRALIEPPPDPELNGLLLELGMTELQHDPQAAIGHFKDALALAGSRSARAEVRLMLAQSHALLTRFDLAIEVLNQAAEDVDEHDQAGSTAPGSPSPAGTTAPRRCAASCSSGCGSAL